MENAIGTSVTSPPFWIRAQTETAKTYFLFMFLDYFNILIYKKINIFLN
jgi:hypothetical protein